MKRHRVLSVRVVEMSVGDGAMALPQVGMVSEFPLVFHEQDPASASSHVRSPDELMTVRGVLILEDGGPFAYRGEPESPEWWWRGLLRGDGWTATWHGPRPLTGPVELTGFFTSSLKIDPGRVRGRITRVRIISRLGRTIGTSWQPIADAPARFRDVDKAEYSHFDDHAQRGDGTYEHDIAALIDLDIDDVPPLPLRPRIIPGSISAIDANALWVADTELPVVARLDTETNQAVEYVLAGDAETFYGVTATPTGCWVHGPGLHRITTGEAAYRVEDKKLIAAASASGETLLAYDNERTWTLHSPTVDSVQVAFPDGEPAAIGIDEPTGDFIVVLTQGASSNQRLRILRVSTTGQVHAGPPLEPPPVTSTQGTFLAGTPMHLFYGNTVSVVTTELTLEQSARIPKRHVGGGALQNRAWILTYRSTADPLMPWWPLPEPTAPASPIPMVPIVTVLDPATLEAQTSWRFDKLHSVTAQPANTWVTDRGHLYRLPANPQPRLPEPVDLPGMIDQSLSPTRPAQPAE